MRLSIFYQIILPLIFSTPIVWAFPATGDFVKYEFAHYNNDGTLSSQGTVEMRITSYDPISESFSIDSVLNEEGKSIQRETTSVPQSALMSEASIQQLFDDCKTIEEFNIKEQKLATCLRENSKDDIYYRAWFASVPWGHVASVTVKSGIKVGEMKLIDFRYGK